MKKIIILSLLTIFVFASCDKIEKPYRIEEEVIDNVDTPDFPELDLDHVIHKILIEEYTGHRCFNCPKGHKVLNNIKSIMGDTVVLLAIHATSLSEPDTINTDCNIGYHINDYRTEAGNNYAEQFVTGGIPAAVFNRTEINGIYAQNAPDSWAEIVNEIERTPADLAIQIIPVFNKKQDTVFIFVKTTLLNTMNANMNLCVLLSESGIVSPQRNSDPTIGTIPDICEYTHNHMLRENISPILGSAIRISAAEESQLNVYALPVSSKWIISHCDIVAFVYDTDTQKVLQAEECSFYTPETNN
ncbi:MAG: Omp28 family outer membrane lipoprotein [Bacteroidales bacterium]|nr:Omp28 family outer membrane lipoprotein [Bacteroidales bacterium]